MRTERQYVGCAEKSSRKCKVTFFHRGRRMAVAGASLEEVVELLKLLCPNGQLCELVGA